MKIICAIYRGSAREQMYLYVEKSAELSRVPEALLKRFGTPSLAMTMLLEESSKLAAAEPARVIEAIRKQGFYLQMPPAQEDDMGEIARKNSKLPL